MREEPSTRSDRTITAVAHSRCWLAPALIVQTCYGVLKIGRYLRTSLLLLGAFASFAVSYMLYRAAVSQAIDWGYMVNTAFDLYRRDLLRQMGFRPPTTIEEERKLWDKLWYFIMWNDTEGLKFNGENLDKREEG